MGQSQHTTMHPDENLLAAFAERTLAPAERGRVLEHLSHCADCRDAVFLAQQAAVETALPFSPRRRTLGALRWQWATASAAGLLAATLIVGLLVVHRQGGKLPATQIAASGQATTPVQTPVIPSTDVLSSEAAAARKPAFHSRSSVIAASAQVAGSVLDPSGAAIAGATVSLKLGDATTGHATTDPTGHFSIPSVPPGNYTVKFIAPGFEPVVRNIDVHAQERAALSEILAVGTASQTVTVSAAPLATQLQTESAEVAVTKDSKPIAGTPLHGRNYTQFVLGAPEVSNQTQQDEAKVGTPTTFSIKHGIVKSCVGKACVARPLPSRSRAVSMAFDGKTVIVADGKGNLFSNTDAGKDWVAIKPQWQGKAIDVKLASTSGAAPGGLVAGKLPASSTFALTNDQGQVWLSSDEGQTWHQK